MPSIFKKEDIIFIGVILLALGLIGGITLENLRALSRPSQVSLPNIDVKKVLERVKETGLEPKEAKFYTVIEK